MDLASYFTMMEYILVIATFVALVLIFLYAFYGREEKEE